jgi:hypothetical protein
MRFKTDNSTTSKTTSNKQNSNDLSESINRSLDEPRNRIPCYNNIVNSHQEQSLQTAKEISEQHIESQKAVINSLQSA